MLEKYTLRGLRYQSGKTVSEIAEALNVTVTSFYRYEKGERRLPLEMVLKLSNLFNVTVEEIVTAAIK